VKQSNIQRVAFRFVFFYLTIDRNSLIKLILFGQHLSVEIKYLIMNEIPTLILDPFQDLLGLAKIIFFKIISSQT